MKTLLSSNEEEDEAVEEAYHTFSSSDPYMTSELEIEIYVAICDEMDIQADRDGFDTLPDEKKLDYLLNRELEYERKCKKRLAEEVARAQWISDKRRNIVCSDSPGGMRGVVSSVIPEIGNTSGEADMYDEPGPGEYGNTELELGGASVRSLVDVLRVTKMGMVSLKRAGGSGDGLEVPTSPTLMTSLKLNKKPLEIPHGNGDWRS
ncbi:hypothetical protein KC19_VG194400 [Ceratodon purpureus]|uniref:Uncharacterized protein n=1 Tax=Ceratodon purpureus TaxID=3225 RepID=A0A8T0HRK9_CERPU|nr:hypothetical protein KC19_VG194400 [Ceratodon purpureus]